jgi:transglutaminase-like putative cysteine protease
VGARVYRRDGGTEEGRRVEGQAMLPPLNVGDIVAVRYRVSDTAQSFFGDFFGASETLGDFVPVDEVRLIFVLPKSRKFYEYVQHGAASAVKREDGDKSIWTFTAKNLSRVPREGMQLPLEQMVPTVQISTYETWKEFGRWYFNLIKKQMEPTPEMKVKVASLIEGKTSERDKARAIYDWVVTNVRYNADWHFGVHGYKPFSAGAIFERCIGDCKDKAIVICTLLGIAGVKAYPVLIRLADSSDPRGREDITLPMPHHFNHAIAYIEYADGKGQFVDGTATFNGFDELPGSDAGANVVIIRPEGGVQTQVPIPPAAENSTREEIGLEFMGKGDRASYLRAIYLQPGTRASQLEAQWTRHKPGAKVTKVEANDLANIDLPPEIRYEVELPDAYTTDAQGNIELAVALNPLLLGKGLAAPASRRTDIAQSAPYQWESVLTIKIPDGMKVDDLPGSCVYDEKSARLIVMVQGIDKTVQVSRTYAVNGGVIMASDYPKLRENMLGFDRAEAAKLKLVKE